MLVRSRLVCVVGICFCMFGWLNVCRQVSPVLLLHLWFGLVRNEILQSLSPKDQERESHPCVNGEEFNCVTLTFASRTSNLLAQMFGFRKCTEFLLMLTSSLRGLLQNQSLETILICMVVLCFPHHNIAGIHLYDECKISIEIIVCHTLWSIS